MLPNCFAQQLKAKDRNRQCLSAVPGERLQMIYFSFAEFQPILLEKMHYPSSNVRLISRLATPLHEGDPYTWALIEQPRKSTSLEDREQRLG